MKIAVGSTNPVKVEAVRSMVERVWASVEVMPISVPSGISEMPMSDEEAIRGAINRANAARESGQADMGIGLEGGVHPEPFGLTLMGWVAVVDGNGRQGLAGAARLPLPQSIAQRVLAGEELGDVMDDILGDHNTKQKGGAVGALTAGLTVRGQAFAQAVAYALSPFVVPGLHMME